ncbi:hypothetical protein P154DRAFT_533064 [Amniculicola lignicola CBS 123094]|uniref:F-box domain-containing protein n=1 Tax=Amniculicola lignicola CBS 123094 TaxID=1392246 RepID=A0A6A5WTT8_9PLEO|nr:hypothetical protein P154DRAFT_533064 [Amniculicola lignicola CBS 123094]
MKRAREDDGVQEPPSKIARAQNKDTFSTLSDELLVRVLSFGSVHTLLACQRVSRKFASIAVDSELWKAAYYKQFVLPRASRIPGIKDAGTSEYLRHSSKLSKWLDDRNLIKNGPATNWKQQYRLRYNWSSGQCAVSEILIAERPPEPPLLVIMHNSTIFTADSISGLRAWDTKNERDLIASTTLVRTTDGTPMLPTSMAIDIQGAATEGQRVAVGFEDGSFDIFVLSKDSRTFDPLFNHVPSSNGMLSALAYASPYLMTMTEDNILSLYSFEDGGEVLAPPRLLYSLRSHTVWPPVSLSIRKMAAGIVAAIAYAIPTYLTGWTVGIQEMRISVDGDILDSRLATAADQNPLTLAGHLSTSASTTRSSSPFPEVSREPSYAKPTSLSYSHPYLLVAHPDNTLTLYVVKSTSDSLCIGAGCRLWGHTSSVSGAHIDGRGKAVSVSRLGDELRVWDLEGKTSLASKRLSTNNELSVRVQAARSNEEPNDAHDKVSDVNYGLRLALEEGFDDSIVSRGWVGFDEQSVIVLREKGEGTQSLVVYDFT